MALLMNEYLARLVLWRVLFFVAAKSKTLLVDSVRVRMPSPGSDPFGNRAARHVLACSAPAVKVNDAIQARARIPASVLPYQEISFGFMLRY